MKTQILVTGSDRISWENEVNGKLNYGWVIVPNTLCISTSISNDSHRVVHNNVYAIVLEGEK